MKNVIYWIGIYSICVFTHELIDHVGTKLADKIHEKREAKKTEECRGLNIKDGSLGPIMGRIGF